MRVRLRVGPGFYSQLLVYRRFHSRLWTVTLHHTGHAIAAGCRSTASFDSSTQNASGGQQRCSATFVFIVFDPFVESRHYGGRLITINQDDDDSTSSTSRQHSAQRVFFPTESTFGIWQRQFTMSFEHSTERRHYWGRAFQHSSGPIAIFEIAFQHHPSVSSFERRLNSYGCRFYTPSAAHV